MGEEKVGKMGMDFNKMHCICMKFTNNNKKIRAGCGGTCL